MSELSEVAQVCRDVVFLVAVAWVLATVWRDEDDEDD
jgi:hypothetical protein